MSHGIKLLVWGDKACFTRPEMKSERVSYDVPTPSAIRGVLTSIYWKPEIRWVVDKIHVLKPIRFTNFKTNEIGHCIKPQKVKNVIRCGGRFSVNVEDNRQQRSNLILRDVCYGVEAHFEVLKKAKGVNENEKHYQIFKRRAEKGAFFETPYLGIREYMAYYELVDEIPECHEELQGERDLGFMLCEKIYKEDPKGSIIRSNDWKKVEVEPAFFRAIMKDGVIDVPTITEGESA